MATKLERKKASRLRRKYHIRKVVNGTSERPRLLVVRSLKHISASLVDDDLGITLTGVVDKVLKDGEFPVPEVEDKKKKEKTPMYSGKIANAYRVGMAIASLAKERGISAVVFDRNGLRYQGRIKACAEGARKGGLEF
jgi:large subunit ribosomal protein L18